MWKNKDQYKYIKWDVLEAKGGAKKMAKKNDSSRTSLEQTVIKRRLILLGIGAFALIACTASVLLASGIINIP